MVRKTLILLLLLLPSYAFGQITIEGPKTGTMGYRSKAKLTLEVQDPKITCFPANDDWMAIQDFAGQKFIDFVPGKSLLLNADGKTYMPSRLFTFVVAGNKDNKTHLQTWEITITPDSDTPSPAPPPSPTELDRTLQAAYMVSPDLVALAKLIAVYKDFQVQVDANKFTNHREALEYLKSKAPQQLQAVKDVVAQHFAASNPRASQWDKASLSFAIGQVITSLLKIK